MIKGVIVIKRGMPLFEYPIQNQGLEFYLEVLNLSGAIDVETENYKITLERSKNMKKWKFLDNYIALISGNEKENDMLHGLARVILYEFNKKYENSIKNFNGDISIFKKFKKKLEIILRAFESLKFRDYTKEEMEILAKLEKIKAMLKRDLSFEKEVIRIKNELDAKIMEEAEKSKELWEKVILYARYLSGKLEEKCV